MNADKKWSDLGWKHPLWDLVRYYLSLRGTRRSAEFRQNLSQHKTVLVYGETQLPIEPKICALFDQYLEHRSEQFRKVFACLRSEEEALAHCAALGVRAKQTTTQKDHHQSSKSVVAAVSTIAITVCSSSGVNTNPQTRCVWCETNALHVSVRNIDGAIPGLFNPKIIWEIKEYWGKTSGGSKMSDAVYECHLVGLEMRLFEEKTKHKVLHIVFVDGKDQWTVRKSDLNRFIDLLNQGLIDHLFVGRMIETDWSPTLSALLTTERENS